MQGFNRYIPPDYDPKKASTLNAHQGKKHALGKRAKDIDKGILIVRFELPFNIWCGTCNAHLGAGVRYNAQKRKVGNYYSTPIYAFRCKCHLCSGWFEIRTDPKNAAYVVEEGARKKDEDWNPEENGGFAVHDTEAPSAAEPPADPFAHVEKTIDQQTWAKRGTSRITELTQASQRLSGDPYLVSSALRRKFREEKKAALVGQKKDEDLREKYGLHEDLWDLGKESVEESKEMWEVGRERKGLPIAREREVGESSTRAVYGTPISNDSTAKGKGRANEGAISTPTSTLAQVLRQSTTKKYDPFAISTQPSTPSSSAASPLSLAGLKTKGRVKDPSAIHALKGVKLKIDSIADASAMSSPRTESVNVGGLGGGLLAGYGSD